MSGHLGPDTPMGLFSVITSRDNPCFSTDGVDDLYTGFNKRKCDKIWKEYNRIHLNTKGSVGTSDGVTSRSLPY